MVRQSLNYFTKKTRACKLLKILAEWNRYTQTSAKSKKKRAVVKVRCRWNTLVKFLRLWRIRYDEAILDNYRVELAATHWATLCKLKTLRGWILYVNRNFEKIEFYGQYLQIYYKNLLRRILIKWGSLKEYYERTQESSIVITRRRPFHRKSIHFSKWKQEHIKCGCAKRLYSRILRKRVLRALRQKLVYAEKCRRAKEIVSNNYKNRVKRKAIIWILEKTKERIEKRKTLNAMKRKLYFTKLRRILKVIKEWTKTKQENKAKLEKASAVHHKLLYSKAFKTLYENKVQKQTWNMKLKMLTKAKLQKLWTALKSHATLQRIFGQVFVNHCTNTLEKMFINWRYALRKRLSALCDADIRRSLVVKVKTLRNWHKEVEKRKHVQILRQSLSLQYHFSLVKKVLHGLKWHTYNPERVNQKKTVCFYLAKRYKKSLKQLLEYARHKRFKHSLDEYYKLRLRKKALGEWVGLYIMTVKSRQFYEKKVAGMKRKILFKMLVHTEQRKQRAVLISQANDYKFCVLARKVFTALKENLAKKCSLEELVSKVIYKKESKLVMKVLRGLKEYYRQRTALRMSTKSYRSYLQIKRINHAVNFLKLQANMGVKGRQIRSKTLVKIIQVAFNKLQQYARNRLHKKMLINETRTFCQQNILRKCLYCLKEKRSRNKICKNRISEAYKAKAQKLQRKTIAGFSKIVALKKAYRSKARTISETHGYHVLENCMKKLRTKYMLRTKQRQYSLLTKQAAFKAFMERLNQLKIRKETTFTQLHLSLHFYAETLSKKVLKAFKLWGSEGNIKRKYEEAMHMFVMKRHFEVWKRVFFMFSTYGTIQRKTTMKSRHTINSDLYAIAEQSLLLPIIQHYYSSFSGIV
eukprot:TRINITY_DN26_c0_g2_i1.p1 TRINITY_DN26_c0_g2~~TRINITY_DN26_c0_g2_i1.p1  ORF type:complete len:864 (-),score=72.26 TRINITY_DN26_c0_g2_i1:2953-5544(-)